MFSSARSPIQLKIVVGVRMELQDPATLNPWLQSVQDDIDRLRAAIRAVQYFPEVKIEFQRWQRRKGKPIARALVAKELATIVYAMLSKGQPFNKQFHGRTVTTTKRCTWPRLANPPA